MTGPLTGRGPRLQAAVTAVLLVAAGLPACGSAEGPGRVTVLAPWTGKEGDDFRTALGRFEARTGIEVDYVGVRDAGTVLAAGLKSGDPPDVAIVSDPNELNAYAANDRALPLDQVVGFVPLASSYPAQWLELMRAHTGYVHAVVVKATLKSLVWYAPGPLRAQGAPVPRSWADLATVARHGAAAGIAPWCLGLQSTSATGWPGTDWIEDIVLHEYGPPIYQLWADGSLAWTSPQIREAWQRWGEVVRGVDGGSRRPLLTGFGDAGAPLFTSPPGCLLDHEASFIMASYPAPTRPAYAVAPFPRINPSFANAEEIAADFAAMFRSTPQSRRLMAFLASPDGQLPNGKPGGPADRGALSVHNRLPLSAYGGNPIATQLAQLVTGRTKPFPDATGDVTLSFDASDLMPPAMRSAFYQAVLEFVAQPSRLDEILRQLDRVQQHAY